LAAGARATASAHRGDVRLALSELEKKGLVERIPNRGAIVRDVRPKEGMDTNRIARSSRNVAQ